MLKRPMSKTWYMANAAYRLFILRELSSVFNALYMVFLLLLLWNLMRGKADYDAFLSSRRGCRVSSDCALAMAQCPLPCYQPVAASAVKEVEAFGEQLVANVFAEHCGCSYKCGPRKFACIKGACTERADPPCVP